MSVRQLEADDLRIELDRLRGRPSTQARQRGRSSVAIRSCVPPCLAFAVVVEMLADACTGAMRVQAVAACCRICTRCTRAARICPLPAARGRCHIERGGDMNRIRSPCHPCPTSRCRPRCSRNPRTTATTSTRRSASVMGLHAIIPNDAFTAETLGTERAGNGVLIRENGVVLTIGYLITEAETIWLHLNDGRVVPGHVLGYDQATGFGLVQALAKLDLPALPLGNSTMIPLDEKVVVGGRGRAPALGRGARGRQAGIRRLLGIRARRGDLHRAGASELGRHRADRPGRRPARHRLAAARARARARAERASQHDRADRRSQADPRRPDEVRPAEPPAAALARPLCHRGRGQDRRGRAREPRAGAGAPTSAPATSSWRSRAAR